MQHAATGIAGLHLLHALELLEDGLEAPGRMQVDFIGTDDRGRRLDSGVYFMRLQSEGRTVTRKIVLLK
ncbi:MAG TPA: T9SS type A sorting domain-containing protein [Candidatus Krumholzibacteria bacterium]|nr:T9SS type A sorting domain-containing protein [Candidatus Krumholzibacteria bacterium]